VIRGKIFNIFILFAYFLNCLPFSYGSCAIGENDSYIYGIKKDFDLSKLGKSGQNIDLDFDELDFKDVCEKAENNFTQVMVNGLKDVLHASSLNPVNSCDSKDTSSDDEYEFRTTQLLKNYKKLTLSDLQQAQYSQYLKEFGGINQDQDTKNDEKRERIHYNKSRKTKKAAKKGAEVLVFEGPGVVGKGVGKVVALGVGWGIKKAQERWGSDEPRESIDLNKLLPPKRKQIAFIKGTSGIGMIALGASGIAAATVTAGASGAVFGPVSVAGQLAVDLIETKLNKNENRDKVFRDIPLPESSKDQPPNDPSEISRNSSGSLSRSASSTIKKIGSSLLGESGLDRGTSSKLAKNISIPIVEEIVDHGVEQVVSTATTEGAKTAAEMATLALPFVGSVYLITQGSKRVYQSIKGFEQGHEFLLAHEENYKNLVLTYAKDTKRILIEALDQTAKFMNAQESNFKLRHKTHCLCKALKWETRFIAKATQEFDDSIDYLRTQVKIKQIVKPISDAWGGNSNEKLLKETIRQIWTYEGALETENAELIAALHGLQLSDKTVDLKKIRERGKKISPSAEEYEHSKAGGVTYAPYRQNEKNLSELKKILEDHQKRLNELYSFQNYLLKEVSVAGKKIDVLVLELDEPDNTSDRFKMSSIERKIVRNDDGDQMAYRTHRKDLAVSKKEMKEKQDKIKNVKKVYKDRIQESKKVIELENDFYSLLEHNRLFKKLIHDAHFLHFIDQDSKNHDKAHKNLSEENVQFRTLMAESPEFRRLMEYKKDLSRFIKSEDEEQAQTFNSI
jgi:hypothetical protein